MARHEVVVMVDDLDETEGADTVKFSLDGLQFEIDLAKHNQEKLAEALAPFIVKARQQRGGRRGKIWTMAEIQVQKAVKMAATN